MTSYLNTYFHTLPLTFGLDSYYSFNVQYSFNIPSTMFYGRNFWKKEFILTYSSREMRPSGQEDITVGSRHGKRKPEAESWLQPQV